MGCMEGLKLQNLFDVLAVLPVTADAVPLLGRSGNNVCFLQREHIGRVVTGQLVRNLGEI